MNNVARFSLLLLIVGCSSASGGMGGGSGVDGGADGGGGGGTDGGGGGGGGTGGDTAAPSSLFPDISPGFTNGEHPQLAVGNSGRLHMIYSGTTANAESVYPVRYGECAGSCGQIANWTFVTIADHAFFGGQARFAVDPVTGKVRANFDQAPTLGGGREIVVATCDDNCLQPANWEVGVVATFNSGVYQVADGSNIAFGAGGKVLLAFQAGSLGASYGECSSNCTTPAGWTWVQFSAAVAVPALAVTASGQPRIAFQDRNQNVLSYTQCDASCTTPGSWSAPITPYYLFTDRFAFALDPKGHPRVTWNQGFTGIAGNEASENKIFYGGCDTGCTATAGWSAFDVGLPASQGLEGLGLALDPTDGTPALVYDTFPDPYGTALAVCTAGCLTDAAAWGSVQLETGAQIQAQTPAPLPNCSGQTPIANWFSGSQMMMVVNPTQGALQIANRARDRQSCGSSGSVSDGVVLPRFLNVPY